MKKKVVALLMGAVLAFSLTACGNEDAPASASSASESSVEESKQESVSEESTEQPTVPEETKTLVSFITVSAVSSVLPRL